MSEDRNFQQRWGLRGRDDADSSSDESKSCSQEDRVLKKHRLLTNSELRGNDEISNCPLLHRGDEVVPHKGSSGFEKSGKRRKENFATKKQIKKQTKSDTKRKGNKTKNTRRKYKPISLDGLKVFMRSVINELKVSREEMFARMNEEMGLTSTVKSASRLRKKKDGLVASVGQEPHENKVELGKKARKTNGASLKRSVKSGRARGSNKSCEVIEDGVIPVKNVGPVSRNKKTKEKSSNFTLKEPIHSFSGRLVSSPFSTLHTAVSEPLAQNLIVAANKSGINLESAGIQNDEMPPQGYFSGTQMPEQFQNVSQMGFHNMSYFNQLRNRTPSSGFPVTLHQGLRNGFSFPSQATENPYQGNDMLGPRIDGGAMRFSGGNQGFLRNYVGNNSSGKSD